MTMIRRWQWVGAASLGMALATLTGCQTWVGGMTLPSGHYLQHPPQYIPPSPPFPLSRELAAQQAQAASVPAAVPGQPGAVPGAPAVPTVPPAPAPVAPAPAPGPVP